MEIQLLKKDGCFNLLLENRLEKRFYIINNLNYYINESIYYRTHKDDIDLSKPIVLWQFDKEFGSINI